MKNNRLIHYYVEGENEKNFIEQLKNVYIFSGKVEVLNILQDKISKARIRTMKPNTTIVLIFDIDIEDENRIITLENNIIELKKSKHVKDIILIPQILNFEDELVYSMDINNIIKFVPSKTKSEFKSDFNKLGKGILDRLNKYNFKIEKMWSRDIPNNNMFIRINKSIINVNKIKL